MISIHPQINSREVLRFTAALSAATREKGDTFVFLFSLIHCFSCLCPRQTIKLIFLLAWFCAALVRGMALPICEEHTNLWWPTQARQQGREQEENRDAGEEGAGQQVLPDTAPPSCRTQPLTASILPGMSVQLMTPLCCETDWETRPA